MKAKFLIFSVLIVLFTSCSKDDDSPKTEEEEVIPADEKFLKDVGGLLTMEYNEERNVERLKIGNGVLIVYGYEDNRISNIDYFVENTNLSVIFTYDANGKIDSFTTDDVVTEVVYNEASKFYLYQKENGDEFTIFVNEIGDIEKIVEFDNDNNETDTSILLYENGDFNGTLTNTNNPLIPTILGLSEIGVGLAFYNISKKPVRTITGPSFGILDFQNTYDVQNFLETSTFGIDQAEVLHFNYMQL